MVTIIAVVSTINSKTGLRKNIGTFVCAENVIQKLKKFWLEVIHECPNVEFFRVNDPSYKFLFDENMFIDALQIELEQLK